VASEPHHGFLRRHAGKLVASIIITFSIVYTLQKGGLKFVPEGGTFAQVRWWTVPLYVCSLAIMSYFRAMRWRYLLRSLADIPNRRILGISMIGFAAILIMPFRLGEFVRPFMIRQKGKISMSAATGTVVAERIVDGLYLSIILAVALVFVPHIEPLPQTVVGLPITVQAVRRAGFLMLAVFLTAFAVIVVFYFARGWAHRMTLAVFGLVSKKLAEKLAGVAERLADGLHAFGRARDALGFLVETSLYWGFNVAGMWMLAWGFQVVHADGSSITFGETCALMGMLGVTILIPGPPGLLGVFQAGIYAAMTMYFPTSVVTGQGAAYVFVMYLVQVAWTVTVGVVFLFGGGRGSGAMFAALSNADEQIAEGRAASELPPVLDR
jgi:glycosyltransferase 2 family protein